MSEKILELKDLSIRYTTDKIISRAVNHVNLSLEKGEVDLSGNIDSIAYSDIHGAAKQGENFLAKLFR